MVRTIIFIIVACGLMGILLTYCAPAKQQGTLNLKPGPTFPEAQKAALGRTVARILPFCPGMSRVGSELLFTHLEVQGEGKGESAPVRLRFTVPQVPDIPAAWGPYTAPCEFLVAGDTLHISGASCQAICLGKVPEKGQDSLSVDLNPKAQRAQ